ncbi:MAG TPA: sodium:alanine symporter family protein [Firmicutes bacterium]|nr:sodium:alanine symporter family protein [Candidatus Fermentithermobacillaceae bacterium]
MDILLNIFDAINSVFWGNFMVFVLVGTGVFFSFRLGFPQIRRLKDAFIITFGDLRSGEKADKKGMSAWQSLSTAIAGQVGTGNIAGPATAIMAGGPGAVFWLWVSAFFGMGTIFSEATAAQKYKATLSDGSVTGGPAFYIRAAFPGKFGEFLAGAFSIFLIIGFGMAAAMIQGNTIADAVKNSFGIPPLATGIIIAILLLAIVTGGITRIASTVSKIVPFMAMFYLVCGLYILVINISNIPAAFAMIFKSAFSPEAIGGGFVGISIREAMRYGIARGLFSNEAGMGSTPHAHAAAKVKHPCDQGLVAMISVVIDSFIILTLSCVIILATGAYQSGAEGIGVIQGVYENTFGSIGSLLITITMFFFCFSTIIAAYFYGEQNFKKLFGVKSVPAYIALILFFVLFGSLATVRLVWAICDTFNGLMVFTNVIGLFAINGVIAKLWKEYQEGGTELDTTLNDIKKKKMAEKIKISS